VRQRHAFLYHQEVGNEEMPDESLYDALATQASSGSGILKILSPLCTEKDLTRIQFQGISIKTAVQSQAAAIIIQGCTRAIQCQNDTINYWDSVAGKGLLCQSIVDSMAAQLPPNCNKTYICNNLNRIKEVLTPSSRIRWL
jgi:hypothetical protein